MKHLRKFNENIFGSREGELYEKPPSEMFNKKTKLQVGDVSLYDALESYHDEEHVDSECHTALDNFVSWLEDNFDYKITKK